MLYTLTNSNFCHFLEDGGNEDNPEHAHVVSSGKQSKSYIVN